MLNKLIFCDRHRMVCLPHTRIELAGMIVGSYIPSVLWVIGVIWSGLVFQGAFSSAELQASEDLQMQMYVLICQTKACFSCLAFWMRMEAAMIPSSSLSHEPFHVGRATISYRAGQRSMVQGASTTGAVPWIAREPQELKTPTTPTTILRVKWLRKYGCKNLHQQIQLIPSRR